MKKISTLWLLSALLLANISVNAQNNDAEIKSLKTKIAKSNDLIKNPKKNQKTNTWIKRADLFMKAHNINSKDLVKGMDAATIPFIGITESTPAYFGKPQKEKREGKLTVWEYKRIKIYISPDGKVDHWVETEIIDPNALNKAYEAYTKAFELDTDNKLSSKKSILTDITTLRDALLNKSIDDYYAEKYEPAIANIEKAVELLKYKQNADTNNYDGSYNYYAGVFSYTGKKLDKAEKFFIEAIKNKYEIGTSYQYLSEILYAKKDTTQAVKILEEGATKFPQEPKIIYCLIDYYNPRGEYNKAFTYIDKALTITPDNSVLYIVKGNAYKKVYEDIEAKYYKTLLTADSLDKAAFRERNNKTVADKIKAKEKNIIDNQIPKIEQDMEKYAKNTVEAYQKGIEKEPNNSDYHYSVALFHYNRAKNCKTNASSIRKLKTIIEKLDKNSNTFMTKAKTAGEKALNIKPDDKYTVNLLQRIYRHLGMNSKYEEMKKRAEELKK